VTGFCFADGGLSRASNRSNKDCLCCFAICRIYVRAAPPGNLLVHRVSLRAFVKCHLVRASTIDAQARVRSH
jgi:hypothetical protein